MSLYCTISTDRSSIFVYNSKKLHFQCYNISYDQGSALASCPWLLFGLPLGGEQSIEVCAAGVAWNMLHGENIS